MLDGGFTGAADVEVIADGGICVGKGENCADGIFDVAEDAGLAAVVVDDDLFVLEGGLDKAWDDHSVLAGLTWADGIEEADCGDFEAVGLVQCVSDGFF